MVAELTRPPSFSALDDEIREIKDLYEVTPGDDPGTSNLELNFHPGQLKAWDSEKRFILVLAGSQGGKTSFGPFWLYREMQLRGPGDYIVATPTYPLLELKALPEFNRLFQDTLKLGRYVSSPVHRFTVSPEGEMKLFGRRYPGQPTRVIFGHAQDPDSLESATGKGAWLDEPGQKKFQFASWNAVRRRLTLHRGRALLTTTPYNLGWLKTEFYDEWEKAGRNHPTIDVINFASNMNPMFSQEEFDLLMASMPLWQFEMFHMGRFTRPAGLIYDCFSDDANTIDDFPIPVHWPRLVGVDFGGVNTAAIFLAAELDGNGSRTGRWFAYREYHEGGRTAREHAEALRYGEPRVPAAVGGAKSEGQWRKEFAAGGLPIAEPDIWEVEPGINRVYQGMRSDIDGTAKLVIFKSLKGLLDQVRTYSRETDDAGKPTEKIENKEIFHLLDGLRYAGTRAFRGVATGGLI